jgi:hypothetical protein
MDQDSILVIVSDSIETRGDILISRSGQSRTSIVEIQKEFRRTLIDVLISSLAKEGRKDVSIDPIALRLISEAKRKDTLQTMDELSRRLEAQAAVPRRTDFTPTDPGDRLPPMPLLVTPTSSHRLSVNPQAPIPRMEVHTPVAVPIVNSPVFDSREDFSSSLDITRRRPSTSGLFRMFSPKPRPHYLLPSLPPSPAVVPSYTCSEDSSAILEEGEASVARLWAAANGSLNSPQDERFLSYPHSAPLPQVPWDIQTRDISRSSTPTLYTGDVMPPSPALTPLPISSPMGYEPVRPSLQSGKRIRSEPMITFSAPPPRFKRNVTGPPHPS